MSRDMIRLMQALFLPGAEACQDAPWRPNTDIYQTTTGWLVKFELAGVRVEDIDLEVLGREMRLCGVRRDYVQEMQPRAAGEGRPPMHHRMEIAYSRFGRVVELPCDLKQAHIETEYRDGMLLVHVDVTE
ncbi:MAG: Hsp20/alpha crystallin family protein [Gemmataceae bacterium]